MIQILDRVHQLAEEQVIAWGPLCIPESRVREWFGRRTEFTVRGLFQEPIPPDCILWLILREKFIPAWHLHELGCLIAEYGFKKLDIPPDPRSIAAVATKRAWIAGDTSVGFGELMDARQAAWAQVFDVKRESLTSAVAQAAAWTTREASGEATREPAWILGFSAIKLGCLPKSCEPEILQLVLTYLEGVSA